MVLSGQGIRVQSPGELWSGRTPRSNRVSVQPGVSRSEVRVELWSNCADRGSRSGRGYLCPRSERVTVRPETLRWEIRPDTSRYEVVCVPGLSKSFGVTTDQGCWSLRSGLGHRGPCPVIDVKVRDMDGVVYRSVEVRGSTRGPRRGRLGPRSYVMSRSEVLSRVSGS